MRRSRKISALVSCMRRLDSRRSEASGAKFLASLEHDCIGALRVKPVNCYLIRGELNLYRHRKVTGANHL